MSVPMQMGKSIPPRPSENYFRFCFSFQSETVVSWFCCFIRQTKSKQLLNWEKVLSSVANWKFTLSNLWVFGQSPPMAIDIASLMTMKISIVNNPSIDKWLLYHMLADLTSLNITIAQDANEFMPILRRADVAVPLKGLKYIKCFCFWKHFYVRRWWVWNGEKDEILWLVRHFGWCDSHEASINEE